MLNVKPLLILAHNVKKVILYRINNVLKRAQMIQKVEMETIANVTMIANLSWALAVKSK